MPYQSEKQAKLMRAVAHGFKPTQFKGPSQEVAKKFVSEDKAHPSGYAGGGSMKVEKHNNVAYARGGAVLGKESEFMKTPNQFRDERHAGDQQLQERFEDQNFAKSGMNKGGGYAVPPKAPPNKSLKPIIPRN